MYIMLNIWLGNLSLHFPYAILPFSGCLKPIFLQENCVKSRYLVTNCANSFFLAANTNKPSSPRFLCVLILTTPLFKDSPHDCASSLCFYLSFVCCGSGFNLAKIGLGLCVGLLNGGNVNRSCFTFCWQGSGIYSTCCRIWCGNDAVFGGLGACA